MDKEKFFTVIAGIGGLIALLGAYLIGFYHGAKIEKEKVIKDILVYQRQIDDYKREIMEKEQIIKELKAKAKKIVNLTQKVAKAINNIPPSKEEEEEETHIDQIFVLQSNEDEEKIKENFLLEPETSSGNSKASSLQNPSKKETSLGSKPQSHSKHLENKFTSSESKTQNPPKDVVKKESVPEVFWTIQLGAFFKYDQAKSFLDRVSKKIDLDYPLFIRKEGKYYKVCLGKFNTKKEVLKALKLLKARKIDGFMKKVTTY